ncbi:MAG: prenyltransferase/squalene oxidase repeat-containing protein [Myxococcota bacterium]
MERSYDVVIVGGGPVGCVTALAHADLGAQVLVLEANPAASRRLAGEWLHPPALSILERYGVGDVGETAYPSGEGFAVFPDDGSEPIELPYPDGPGFSIHHHELVSRLRDKLKDRAGITYREPARVTAVEDGRVTYQVRGEGEKTVTTGRIIGAAGRNSVVHKALGMKNEPSTYSRMAGILLEDCTLPFPGRGHVFLGAPGPVLAYRVNDDQIRMTIDVPLSLPVKEQRDATLWDAYHPVLPPALRRPFFRALEAGNIAWASNQNRPRLAYGKEGMSLVGDAVGHHHPLTALGMTLGFQDGVALAEEKSFGRYRFRRVRDSRVAEMLAVALYEVFADSSDEVVAIRHAVYEMWRRFPGERRRTMRFLACQDTRAIRFGGSFVRACALAGGSLLRETVRSGKWAHSARLTAELAERCRWLLSGAMHLSDARPSRDYAEDETWGPALKAARAGAEVMEHPARRAASELRQAASGRPNMALERAIHWLERNQRPDGGWEGEVVWCPMLPAQYVLLCAATGTEIDPVRRRRLLRQFEVTQLPSGTWGLHELSPPYLFATVLVYTAARLLGAPADGPLLRRARAFIADEGGATAIPSWGKFWLALVGLYEWRGVNPVLPEVWSLPSWLPLHPSNYYCHTRLIYLGMACLYGETFPVGAGFGAENMVTALRGELYPQGYDGVDFGRARHELREAEIFTPPGRALKLAYDALRRLDDGALSKSRRERLRTELLERVRFELHSTDDTCISPVNGMLNLLALYHHDPKDEDFIRGMDRLSGWMWEDDEAGCRIAGARSATWDTAFAAQALAAAAPHYDVSTALERADAFLAHQQILHPPVTDYARHHRIDPTGGYTFAERWHGWPVSDCTAEAMIARLDGPVRRAGREAMTAAARFILRTQCRDGGFGSYEPQRGGIELEWLNPAEMFGDSMTEHPYLECTASSVAALASFRRHFPDVMGERIDTAIARGVTSIRDRQRPDGAWSANWGIHFIYGTLFGIRGLLAAGVPPVDAAIRRACAWLRAHQRDDGGWGESHRASLEDADRPHAASQVIQTAWALSALLEAKDPDWDVIDRGAHFLAARQQSDGGWPKEDPSGVFFHTALLHYELYRQYFPLWALGLYETRRLERDPLLDARSRQLEARRVAGRVDDAAE